MQNLIESKSHNAPQEQPRHSLNPKGLDARARAAEGAERPSILARRAGGAYDTVHMCTTLPAACNILLRATQVYQRQIEF
jgi:hypothetical protein